MQSARTDCWRTPMNTLSRVTLAALLSAAPVLAAQPRFAFEPNVGQADASARFLLRTRGGTFFFTPDGVVLAPQTAQPKAGVSAVRMRFVAANPAVRMGG